MSLSGSRTDRRARTLSDADSTPDSDTPRYGTPGVLTAEIESLDEDIATMIRDAGLTPAHELLQTVPGIRAQAAATILAESGPDMKQFPAVTNFSSWTGLAPGNNESARKKRTPALKGNPRIKTALVEAA